MKCLKTIFLFVRWTPGLPRGIAGYERAARAGHAPWLDGHKAPVFSGSQLRGPIAITGDISAVGAFSWEKPNEMIERSRAFWQSQSLCFLTEPRCGGRSVPGQWVKGCEMNFMCQVDQAMLPSFASNRSRDVDVKVFLDEINI